MVISTSSEQKYLTEISNGTEKIYSDVSEEKGGHENFFRPHEFLEAAYASCLNITTRMFLDALELPYESVTVKVELERSDEATAIFRYHIDITGAISENARQLILRRIADCPVKKTLSKHLEFRPA